MNAARKAVFLDRDGVINQTVFRRGAPRAPQDLSEWVYLDGVQETLGALAARGYLLLVCTNQPDVARGWQTREQVDAFHQMIERELPISRVYACFHDGDDACECRKPKPGLLLQGAADFGIDLARSFMIGDRGSDVAAGRAAGCRTIHLKHPSEPSLVAPPDPEIRELRQLLDLIR